MEDWQLIEAYAGRQSESAFAALIERHARLVYGSALRQVRDPQLAQDITQSVFLLLARKAPGLSRNTVLSGWLFQTTRFVASHALRGEQRRRRREQEAFEMQQLNSADDTWRRMEPVLDDALHQLQRDDRNAVLLRFMEGRSLREVASALGVTEEAAKKRVARALEKLRKVLAQGGVSASAVILGDALSAGAQAALPPAVLASLSATAATATTPAASALASEVIAAWRWFRIKVATGAATAAVLVVLLSAPNLNRPPMESGSAPPATRPETQVVQPSTTVFAAGNVASEPETPPFKVLSLRAVDAVTGQGIPNAPVAAVVWAGEEIEERWGLATDASGTCQILYPPETGRLDAGVLAGGWEARYATWPSEGLPGVPDEWTLALERTSGVIGGIVLDSKGNPLPDAEIWFLSHETGDSTQRERPRERFGFFLLPVTRTDARGRWEIGFIPSRHPGFTLRARHPEYAETSIISSSAQESVEAIESEDVKQLWAGELVTTMKAAFTLTGRVVDESGRPIAGARIQEHPQSEIHTADHTGTFRVRGLPERGAWPFTVSADGFAPERAKASLGPETGTIIVTLQPGAVLRLRVVDEHGHEVPDATVGLQRWGEHRNALQWRQKTDWIGRVEWNSAPPAVDLELYAHKHGFCWTRDIRVRADGEEHVIRLRRAIEVHGRVVDANTGFGIQDFKALPGYGKAHRFYDDNMLWHADETVRGTNGLFKLVFGENERPWQVRLIAEGYEDWISDELPESESTVTLEIALKPKGS